MREMSLPAAIDEGAPLEPAASQIEPTKRFETNPLEDATAVDRWTVGKRSLRCDPMLVRDGLDALAEVAVAELGPFHSQMNVVERQLRGGDCCREKVHRA